MTRSRTLHVAAAAMLIASCVNGQQAPPTRDGSLGDSSELPNVVILYADDLGYGDLAIQNPESKIATPALDQLAREGVRFTDAHSSSGICTPSRYALLTGRYHWRKFHDIVHSFGPPVISPERLTMPEMLQKKGYRTACVGKWHLGWDWDAIKRAGADDDGVDHRKHGYSPEAFDWTRPIPGGPLAHGFDHYFGDDVPNFPPYAWIENDRIKEPPTTMYVPDPKPDEGSPEGRPGPMVKGWKQDAVMPELTRRACAFLEGQKDSARPFFLYFAWTSPHAPIVPTKESQGKTAAGAYGDFVRQSDGHAGEVLRTIDRLGFRDRTIVIFSSDNGPESYAYARARRFGHRSMGPLRGLKRDVFEGGHRVPLVVRWPGAIKPGTVSDALISQIDLMATLAAIVGFELPRDAAEDSYDLSALLRNAESSKGKRSDASEQPSAPPVGRDHHVHNTFARVWAIRSGHWLLVDAKSGEHSKVPPGWNKDHGYPENTEDAALFDLSRDLGQRTNLSTLHPGKVREMRALLSGIRKAGHSAPRLTKN